MMMGPAFSLEIVNLETEEVRLISVDAGWNEDCADKYRGWCDCGAAGYFNRGHVDADGKFVDGTTESHTLRARAYLSHHVCDHATMTRFKILRARLQDGRTIEIASAPKTKGDDNASAKG
jgi:hypothetical protein